MWMFVIWGKNENETTRLELLKGIIVFVQLFVLLFIDRTMGTMVTRKKNVYKIMSSEKMSIKLHILQFSVVEVCQQDYYFRKNTIFSTCHNVMIWIEWHFLWFHTIIMNGCWWSWENVSRLNSKRWLLCSKFICHMHQFLSLIHVQLNHKPLMPIFTI